MLVGGSCEEDGTLLMMLPLPDNSEMRMRRSLPTMAGLMCWYESCLGPYGGPREGAVSFERGTPIPLALRSLPTMAGFMCWYETSLNRGLIV